MGMPGTCAQTNDEGRVARKIPRSIDRGRALMINDMNESLDNMENRLQMTRTKDFSMESAWSVGVALKSPLNG